MFHCSRSRPAAMAVCCDMWVRFHLSTTRGIDPFKFSPHTRIANPRVCADSCTSRAYTDAFDDSAVVYNHYDSIDMHRTFQEVEKVPIQIIDTIFHYGERSPLASCVLATTSYCSIYSSDATVAASVGQPGIPCYDGPRLPPRPPP